MCQKETINNHSGDPRWREQPEEKKKKCAKKYSPINSKNPIPTGVSMSCKTAHQNIKSLHRISITIHVLVSLVKKKFKWKNLKNEPLKNNSIVTL